MMKKKLLLSKIRQLIDLNGNSVNFEVDYRVVSDSKKPFEIAIVSQTQLDRMPVLPYKKVNGVDQGTFSYNKGEYQNYFMVLKSDQGNSVNIEINKKELKSQPNNFPPQYPREPTSPSSSSSSPSSSWKIWAIIGVVIVGGGIIAWLYFSQKKKDKDKGNDKGKGDNKVDYHAQFNFDKIPKAPAYNYPPYQNAISSPRLSLSPSRGVGVKGNIVERLKNLNV